MQQATLVAFSRTRFCVAYDPHSIACAPAKTRESVGKAPVFGVCEVHQYGPPQGGGYMELVGWLVGKNIRLFCPACGGMYRHE